MPSIQEAANYAGERSLRIGGRLATKVVERLTYAQNAATPELARLSKWFSAETLIKTA